MVYKRKKRGRSGCAVVLVIVIILVGLYLSRDLIARQFIYPDTYHEEIVTAAEANEMEPALLFAVVREESRFRADAKSAVGAQGLMQLMPDTARWVCEKAPFNYDPETAVWEPAANVMMGAWYLKWLSESYYEGNQAAAIAAYNAGQQNVNRWLQNGSWDGTFTDAKSIPYGETASFLDAVGKSYLKYQDLYDFQ